MKITWQQTCHTSAVISLVLLIALSVAWELVLAPLRPGGSWMVLKVLPLLVPLRGVLKCDIYTLQWSSMLSLLYFCEGVVRATSDRGISVQLGWIEAALASIFFFCTILYVQPYKKTAKKLAQEILQKTAR